ncbi:DinB family protein [Chitinophaga qingshengii]|uniref:DinB family protein n=1 Tax=Chitinophaga qingshengii TaxID=1569794 RepID=A0ABR7TUD8_9BACT|nr:DinB family protein [Chitinophaga qingshengii]MBC9933056.1 DinB family protein [Chitinophaga qingshengii]
MKRTAWFDRSFPAMTDNGVMPGIIERLSGTPARAEELTRGIAEAVLVRKSGDEWSAKEELGHLSDLEPLWAGRLGDFINGLPELRVADLTNRRTHEAHHNDTGLAELLQRFRQLRTAFVQQLLALDDTKLDHTALHPRLKTPMRIIDLAYFVAEHDDHHLAGIREKISTQ